MPSQLSAEKLFSFEYSAPRDDEARDKLMVVHQKLAHLQPHFYSVTYGAGGSTKAGTREAVLQLAKTGANVAPHLSFGSDKAEHIGRLIEDYRDAGISRLVALRGDIPSGIGGSASVVYASDLVRFVREVTGDHFHIEVAAYPEIHPDSTSLKDDLHYFKAKVDAGANSAITQYFYNPDAYFRYIDNCTALGINIPIVPGVMPITNYQNLVRFSDKCGAEIPRWMRYRLADYQDDRASLRDFGIDLVTVLCDRLLAGGAPGLHFYTLNQSLLTLKICRNLGLSG